MLSIIYTVDHYFGNSHDLQKASDFQFVFPTWTHQNHYKGANIKPLHYSHTEKSSLVERTEAHQWNGLVQL